MSPAVPKSKVPLPGSGEPGKPFPAPSHPPVVLRAELHYGPPLFGYALSLALITVTGALRLALMREEPAVPFILFYPAIAAASFLAGVGPGLLGLVLGALFAVLFFPETPSPANWMALAVVGPLFVTGFAHLRHIREQHLTAAKALASFKFIGDHASDWILLLDETGHIRYANLRACGDLGWTGEELSSRHIDSLVPESQKPALKTLLETSKSSVANPIEVMFERHDKTLVLIELGCTAVRTKEDLVIYAVARGIGERKHLEQKLREVRHWESLGVLAGGVAHDFNNLLTSILGYATLAKDTLPTGHEALPMLDSIVSAGEKSADLVRMMLASAGYRPRYNERLELDGLLHWMLANRPLPPNVRVSCDVESAFFTGDRRSFETLLWSLISNAAESYGGEAYSKNEGVVRIAMRTGIAPRASRATFEEGDPGTGECLGIIVEDRGCGMAPDVLDRAFDPFFSTKFTGRGLGLAAVRGIVRAYSGKLLLETAPGEGTRVEVWLPARIPEA
jgi:two-component system cell cycle sensor histidine kinase/response regulator CckA